MDFRVCFICGLGCRCLADSTPEKWRFEPYSVHKDLSQTDNPKLKLYVLWLILSALPSAFFLSVTNLIALEIGSFPLVWIIPLALYLASFIVTFKNNAVFRIYYVHSGWKVFWSGLCYISFLPFVDFGVWAPFGPFRFVFAMPW